MSEFVLHVNGARHQVNAPADESLLWVLRNRLNLTGTKYGCGEGECGACTVLADGQAIRSCQVPASAATSMKIVTIEGIAADGKLSPVQEAFLDEEAMQCGYCTSGMIMNATSLLRSKPHPTPDEIVEAMNGNICRCGTYPRIVAAIRRAAGEPEEGGSR
jgi:aerobic-type carbon monoxide dehydrogenase small subunit (CoxS/CutS family)